MMKIILLITVCLAFSGMAQINNESREPRVVKYVDLERYTGVWYEIAKIPNPFQKKCAQNTTAEYTIREDGKIDVVNRCTKENEEIITAKGLAKIVDTSTFAKLKVSFVSLLGIRLFWGDYWIIGLDDDYRWAIVGDPSRKYGWILSRTTQLSDNERNKVNELLKAQGYDPERFMDTVQETRGE